MSVMNNTRFATSIHILTLLAYMPDEWLSSEYISGSININAVVVRRELSVLSEAGLIVTKKGKEGGAKLSKPSEQILLSDIFLAVKNSDILGKKNQHTNPSCPIGYQINDKLDILFSEIENSVIHMLEKKSLADFFNQFD